MARGLAVALHPLEIRSKVRRRLVAVAAVFFDRPADDALELRRNIRVELDGRLRFTIEERVEDDRRGISAEGAPPRRHLIKDDAEREQIGARVELLASGLLRRHVGDGPD